MLPIARLPDGGGVVDVDAEEDHQAVLWRKNAGGSRALCPDFTFRGESFRLHGSMSDPRPSPGKPVPRPQSSTLALPSILALDPEQARASGTRLGAARSRSAFPIGYGIADFVRRRQANFISIIGFFSILLTGIFALIRLDRFWFAVKEASLPAIIGVSVLASMRSKVPLVRQLLYNDQVIDVEQVDSALAARGTREPFDRALRRAGLWLAGSFALSAALNFALARHLIRSDSGTAAFNEELAQMNLWSWPVIVVPSVAITMVTSGGSCGRSRT
jgi:hypothetical protein